MSAEMTVYTVPGFIAIVDRIEPSAPTISECSGKYTSVGSAVANNRFAIGSCHVERLYVDGPKIGPSRGLRRGAAARLGRRAPQTSSRPSRPRTENPS